MIKFIISIFVAIFVLMRIGSAMLIYDATVIVKPIVCMGVDGSRVQDDKTCFLDGDYSHQLLTGYPVIKLRDGSIMYLDEKDVHGVVILSSRCSIGW